MTSPHHHHAFTIPNIQRIAFFACDTPKKVVEVTSGLSSIFNETMIDFEAAQLALVKLYHLETNPPSEEEDPDYCCHHEGVASFLTFTIRAFRDHPSFSSRFFDWVLVAVLRDKRLQPALFDFTDHTSPFYATLKMNHREALSLILDEAIREKKEKNESLTSSSSPLLFDRISTALQDPGTLARLIRVDTTLRFEAKTLDLLLSKVYEALLCDVVIQDNDDDDDDQLLDTARESFDKICHTDESNNLLHVLAQYRGYDDDTFSKSSLVRMNNTDRKPTEETTLKRPEDIIGIELAQVGLKWLVKAKILEKQMIEFRSGDGYTALMSASYQSAQLVRMFIEACRENDVRNNTINEKDSSSSSSSCLYKALTCHDGDGWTCFHFAARNQRFDTLVTLLRAAKSVDNMDSSSTMTPIVRNICRGFPFEREDDPIGRLADVAIINTLLAFMKNGEVVESMMSSLSGFMVIPIIKVVFPDARHLATSGTAADEDRFRNDERVIKYKKEMWAAAVKWVRDHGIDV